MKRRIAICTVATLFLSCNKNNQNTQNTQNAVTADTPLILVSTADSLQAAADSLEIKRKLHSVLGRQHIHAPGSDLAETAHQDIPQKERMRKSIKEASARGRAIAAARGKKQLELEENLVDIPVWEELSDDEKEEMMRESIGTIPADSTIN